MNQLVKNIALTLFVTLTATTAMAADPLPKKESALDLDALLKQLEEGKFQQTTQNNEREKEFIAKRAEQDQMLRNAAKARDAALQTSENLETTFEENEFKLGDLNDALTKRLGSLKELFGVLQQVAGDTKSKFFNSVISAQIPNRAEFLDEMAQSMGSSSKLASIDEIERVWFEMQREMTESGKVTRFTKLLVQAPSLKERVEQGGLVGYIILIVGAIGLLLALERLISLTIIKTKVNKQLKSDKFTSNNPLGRVMQVRDKYPEADTESLELHLTEAILGEIPKLSRNLTIIKIISVVAPLMGLLGTVTGMINTFQAITLFGTGDPKLMAGGISTALVTTVLGLVVAIPMTLLYAMLNTRSKDVVFILQEQASGVIAERAERMEAKSTPSA